jgi:hypothetical protein
MPEGPPTWALLAPVGRGKLDALAQEYWREQVSEDEDDYDKEGWEIVGGTGDYSAVVDRNPGSEYTHDTPLAERLSRALKRPVYVLYLNEGFAAADPVAVYENGRQTGQRPRPYEVARSLGVTLPADSEAERGGTPRSVRAVVIVEAGSAADVARALDMKEPPRGPVHIVDGPAGAIFYNDASPYVPAVAGRLSNAFPEKNVYTVSTGPQKGAFVALVTRGGQDVGVFLSPAPADPGDRAVLDSVKGETTPQGIAAALGVPPGLMKLP